MAKNKQANAVVEAQTELIELGGVSIPTDSALAEILTGELITAEEAADEALPYLKMHHAIEQTLENHNHMHLYSGGNARVLEEGYQVTVLQNLRMIRKSIKDDKGKVKYVKAYETEESMEQFEQLHAEHKKDESNQAVKMGRVYLLALIIDDVVTIAEFETCGLADKYWGFLPDAKFPQQKLVQINLENHKENLKKSETSGFTYHDPRRFTQYTFDRIPRESLEIVAQEIIKQDTLLKAWKHKAPAGAWE